MRVCLDTNTLLQIFGRTQPFRPIKDAMARGRIELAVSTAILLEYEETITRLSGRTRWQEVEQFLIAAFQLHANILFIDPQFRFHLISSDPDDNKFVDCAIAAQADYIITSDHDFDVLLGKGYKPKPITPDQFVAAHC